jgi:CBS domain-containing protein
LKKHELGTQPDFESAYIDSRISFVKAATKPIGQPGACGSAPESTKIVELSTSGISTDPTQRIGKLASANKTPVSIKPDATLTEAVTIMLYHDFSQLPVMTSERDVKGMISWSSIGSRLSQQRDCKYVRDFMESPHEISSDTSLFDAIDTIVKYEYVLIRDSEKKISGIVTTSDLSLQFRQLGEPFLLLGEIENHIRSLIDGKYTVEQLNAVRDPNEPDRGIKNVNDLTFGEYVRLLQNPDHWALLKLGIARQLFVSQLDKVREIRNDVMHFDPDGIGESDLQTLREFVQFLQRVRSMGVF